ncbi:hypothetical protein SAMN05216589_3198 [Halopseudomonas bauzanensis]|uniref:Uncharacterized protein n=1 Tax=Halopseudomonas bauzanensis TaxID=653930 RepID=A0A031M9B2_9GAMM|nr:hypothetical protein CF98_08255 [Halopseudomonas bauzanensis]SES32490.1 hypothetical protein SAMN05216589_3198 [Halopseudomonas bauzanensis]SFM32536.1 hypothetical protein SAMN04487855_3194 [Halopseudomonas bauzanensis]
MFFLCMPVPSIELTFQLREEGPERVYSPKYSETDLHLIQSGWIVLPVEWLCLTYKFGNTTNKIHVGVTVGAPVLMVAGLVGAVCLC